jgi:hypothetical protein
MHNAPLFRRTERLNGRMRRWSLAHIVLSLALPFGAAHAASPAPAPLRDVIVPHRAVYDISLARSDDGSGVSNAEGRMVFEVTGNPCEGYRMRQRMVVNLADEDGNPSLLDFRIATFESGDGDSYTFDTRTTMNEDVVETVEGEAQRSAAGIEVKLKQPSQKTVRLDPDTLFPSQHLQAIIDAARARQNFVSVEIYEGAGSGEATDEASATIGKGEAGSEGPLRAGVRRWPVSIGYFDGEQQDDFGEELPSYQMQFTLYENGVTNDLVMDYGKYALSGSLQKIEPLEAHSCPSP